MTLFSILANLKIAAVCMVSTRPHISKSSSPCSNHLVTIPRAPIIIGINATFMFLSFFQFPSKVQVLILFAFLQFYSEVSPDSKFHKSVDYYWSSGRVLVIGFCLKIPVKFVHLILGDKFWLLNMLFVRMVKF